MFVSAHCLLGGLIRKSGKDPTAYGNERWLSWSQPDPLIHTQTHTHTLPHVPANTLILSQADEHPHFVSACTFICTSVITFANSICHIFFSKTESSQVTLAGINLLFAKFVFEKFIITIYINKVCDIPTTAITNIEQIQFSPLLILQKLLLWLILQVLS